MNTHNEIETLTALLICAASEITEADDIVLPAWALNEDGDPNLTAIVSAGRQLLHSRNGAEERAREQVLDSPAEAEHASAVNSVGEMIDKAYSACKLTAVVMAFGVHCASRCGVVKATHYALQDCELESGLCDPDRTNSEHTMDNSQDLIAALIAKGFSHALRMNVASELMDRINELNRTNPHAPCASHEFTTANRYMETAFSTVIGRPPASYLQEDAFLWQDAWRLARSSDFNQTADIERLAAGLHQDREAASTLLQLRDRYPQIAEWPMGEDCMALRMEFSDGSYVLLSESDEPRVPDPSTLAVRYGLYANQGDELRATEILQVSQVQAMIDFRAALVSEPRTVYDYFVRVMRAAPGENLSLLVPLTSQCGAVCAEAIDVASDLIGHVHSSSDSIDNYRDSDRIIAMTRRVLSNYINVRDYRALQPRKCG